MRALRVLGLADGGATLVCEDQEDGEQFILPRDEKLRAAARGDASRFGQLEIEGESQLRPREIQARIRGGATVEEIAALAGTSIRRIESFAHPVLLERSTMADRARKARPSIDGITGSVSVEETVTATLAARGQDQQMSWDAYRETVPRAGGEDAAWVLVLRWHAGRSENRARWVFHPGPAGGTLTARDDAAAEIVDPALRVLRPIRENLRQVSARHPAGSLLDPTTPSAPSAAATAAPRPAAPVGAESTAAQVESQVESNAVPVAATGTAGRSINPARVVPPTSRAPYPQVSAAANPVAAAVAVEPDAPSATAAPARTPVPTAAKAGKRSTRPAMPSWEDVLLGTRSTGRD